MQKFKHQFFALLLGCFCFSQLASSQPKTLVLKLIDEAEIPINMVQDSLITYLEELGRISSPDLIILEPKNVRQLKAMTAALPSSYQFEKVIFIAHGMSRNGWLNRWILKVPREDLKIVVGKEIINLGDHSSSSKSNLIKLNYAPQIKIFFLSCGLLYPDQSLEDKALKLSQLMGLEDSENAEIFGFEIPMGFENIFPVWSWHSPHFESNQKWFFQLYVKIFPHLIFEKLTSFFSLESMFSIIPILSFSHIISQRITPAQGITSMRNTLIAGYLVNLFFEVTTDYDRYKRIDIPFSSTPAYGRKIKFNKGSIVESERMLGETYLREHL